MARLSKRVWSNNQLTSITKLQVYHVSVLNTLLYGSESWTTYAGQENRLESFHLRCLRRILSITWRDKVTNTAVLGRAGSHSIHLLLCQHRLCWLSHVYLMGDGHIPKNVLYAELATGKPPAGRPALRFQDVCKRDFILADIDPGTWEQIADDHSAWRSVVQKGIRTIETGCWRTRDNAGRSVKSPWTPTNPPPSAAPPVTESATRGLRLSATPEAVPNIIDDQTHRAFHYPTR